ncbi:hypothetical protein SAMN03159463_05304 [Mesorhizobium sp. NFR06]|uniref:hypothetical protein n=1 Tax=Mesorhizobium sp. NFR06 TaxID=1566290 RepID=UPI0008EB662D|nr:hypothetical protein [Mesorhizobium sp. NFR06]SFP98085.1 hypothetical protein SAMN03159463_05304 [Mesorhizobium sp. NFR06]
MARKTLKILHDAESIIEGIASSDARPLDGDTDRLDPAGVWWSQDKRLPLYLEHDRTRQIGEILDVWKKGNKLHFRARVDDAETFARIQRNELTTASVGSKGMDQIEQLADGTYLARRWELTEISVAPRGMNNNPHATILAADREHPVSEVALVEPMPQPRWMTPDEIRAFDLKQIRDRLHDLDRLHKKFVDKKWSHIGAVRDAMDLQIQKVDAERAELVAKQIAVETGIDLTPTPAAAVAQQKHAAPAWQVKNLPEPDMDSLTDVNQVLASHSHLLDFYMDTIARTMSEIDVGPNSLFSHQEAAVSDASTMSTLRQLQTIAKLLDRRIADLESGVVVGVKYLGVFQKQVRYSSGSLVTHKGCLWHANLDTTGVEPGDGNRVFTLCAKADGVPLPQRDTAGKRITGNEPRKPRKIERTVVTKHDAQGRVVEFEKEQVEE